MNTNIKAVINRVVFQDKQTLGWFYMYKGIEQLIRCSVLELSFLDNQKNISSICPGVYTVKKRYSPKFGNHFILLDVQGRSYILIHKGNYYKDTEGCLLFGNDFTDFNNDGYLDVTISTKTMKKLYSIAPEEFTLTINEI